MCIQSTQFTGAMVTHSNYTLAIDNHWHCFCNHFTILRAGSTCAYIQVLVSASLTVVVLLFIQCTFWYALRSKHKITNVYRLFTLKNH